MSDAKTYLSKEKHGELQKEFDFLKNTRRKEIAEQIKQAKAFGDLSENAEYHEARGDQGRVESRIAQLESLLKNVEIVKHHKSSHVEVGTTVTVQKNGGGEREFKIVGSEEADTVAGKISLGSPLGEAMVGKSAGEEFSFKTPAGKQVQYKITKIG